MSKDVPRVVKIDLGFKHSLLIKVASRSLPTAYNKRKPTHHFAKTIVEPSLRTFIAKESEMIETKVDTETDFET